MLDFIKKNSTNKIHYIALIILSLNYLVPYFLFGNITLFYHDALDSEIPYNNVIGKYLSGDKESINIFLGGEIQIDFLRRIFNPYSFVYSFLNLELAYWIVDISVKITSYFAFFIMARKISKNYFLSALIACLYASSNLPTHEGFGLAIFPYLIYLVMFKKKLKIKHYLITIFFGLNSDFVFTFLTLPSLVILTFLLKQKNYKNLIKIIGLFSISIILSNFNLFLVNFEDVVFHRTEFLRTMHSPTESIFFFLKSLFNYPTSYDFTIVKKIPYCLFYIPVFLLCFISRDKKIKKILYVLLLTILFKTLIHSELIGVVINEHSGLLKKISWAYISRSVNLLFCLMALLIIIEKKYFHKTLQYVVLTSIFLFQVNSSIVPFIKKNVLKQKNYQNLYTFDGYYNFYDFKKIKTIVKGDRVLSVGFDPMVPTIHDIKVIDGYHSLYPLSYKKRFRKVIENEINLNKQFREYYDDWGSRVYTSLFNPIDEENYKLNLLAAESLGAKYIISKIPLKMKSLAILLDDCKKNGLCLYKIIG